MSVPLYVGLPVVPINGFVLHSNAGGPLLMSVPLIEPVMRRVYRAPTSGRTRATKAAAYREEARARFAATCHCKANGGPCRYHDPDRWERGLFDARRWVDYSHNGLVIARLAALLAREDGVSLPWPVASRFESAPSPLPDDGDIPF